MAARAPVRSPTRSSPDPWRRSSPPPRCSRCAACRPWTACRGRGANGVCWVARSPTTTRSPRSPWPTRSASRATSPSPSSRRGSRRRSSTRCCGTSGLERSRGSSFPRRPRRGMRRGVVERGTGTEAALTNFPVAAETGTARRVVNGRYAAGEYTASFAALFPADQPQLVLVVKIDNPHKGSYFAAQTAAPVTRSMLEQALAARTVALDRARLSTAAPRAAAAPVDDDGGLVPYVVPWPYQPDSAGVGPRRAVPDVAGFGMREAVRTLHRRGFRVALRGWGVAEH